MSSRGERTVTYGRKVGHVPPPHSIGVYVDREATLTEDLDVIERRRLVAITLVFHDGYSDSTVHRFHDRAQVERLRDALTSALEATANDEVAS